MATTHELVLSLQGKLDSSVNSTFSVTSKLLDKVNKKAAELNKIKIKTGQYTELNSQFNKTAQELQNAKAKLGPLNAAFTDSKVKTDSLKQSWSEAEKKVSDLNRAVQGSVNPTKEMRAELRVAKLDAKEAKEAYKASAEETKNLGKQHESASTYVERLSADLEKQTARASQLRSELNKTGASTLGFSEAQQKAADRIAAFDSVGQQAAKTKQAWKEAGAAWKDFGKKVAVGTAAVALPVKFAIESENVMADIAKVTDFKGAGLENFEKQMRKEITTRIPMAFEDYGELVANAAQAGIKDAELLDFSADAARMSVAMDLEAGDAGSMMAKWRTAFSMSQDDVVGLADKINYLSNNTAASAPEISNIVSKVGALADVGGLSAGAVTAMGATMVSMGIDSDVASTGIGKVITNLTKGESASKRQQEVYKKLGMTSKEVAQGMQRDAEGTVLKVLESISQLDASEQAAALTELFGEAGVKSIAPLLTQLDVLKDNFDRVDEAAGKFRGSMQEEFDIRSQTTENQLIILRNSFKDLGAAIGKEIIPFIYEASVKLTELIGRFSEWRSNNEELFSTIIKVVGVVGGLIIAVSGLAAMIKTGFAIYQSFKLVFLVIKLVVALLGGPLTLAIVAVTAVVALLVAKWDWFKEKGTAAIKAVTEMVGKLKNTFNEKMNAIRSKTSEVTGAIKQRFSDAINWIPNKLREISNWFSNILGKSNKVGNSVNEKSHGIVPRARGGIVTKPEIALIGEAGYPETVIPLDGSQRAMDLWAYTGRQLGVDPGEDIAMPTVSRSYVTPGSSTNYNEFKFEFNVMGAGENLEQDIINQLKNAAPELKRILIEMLKEIDHDKARIKFA